MRGANAPKQSEAEPKDQINELARPGEDDDGEDGYGEDCEFHIYDSKRDIRGESILLRVGTKSNFKFEEDRSRRACLVLTRYYSSHRHGSKPYATCLKIQSKYIIKALNDVISSYPGENFYGTTVTIDEPPKCLFHYRHELKAYAEEANDSKMKDHVSLCLKYMEKTMQKEIRVMEEGQGLADPLTLQLDQRNLWTVFKPGCLMFERCDDVDIVSKLQEFVMREDEYDNFLGWGAWTERVVYNGDKFGHVEDLKRIRSFDGRQAVRDLPIFPLRFHPEAGRIQREAELRGRKYLTYCGIHHCLYNGLARYEGSSPWGHPKIHVRSSGTLQNQNVC